VRICRGPYQVWGYAVTNRPIPVPTTAREISDTARGTSCRVCRLVLHSVPEGAGAPLRRSNTSREFISYVLRNSAKPVDYGRRNRKGQSISSAMAESAVNQVINARMCKRQQMRWTPRGAHLLLQVRCAVEWRHPRKMESPEKG
jgi:hypothetical protein